MTLNSSRTEFTPDEIDALFEELREWLRRLPTGANLNDQVKLCIGICIANGIDSKRHIVGTVKKLGFNNFHIGAIIDNSTGNNPERHLWSLGEDGRYRNLDVPSTVPDMD